jgi:hypothetical protein
VAAAVVGVAGQPIWNRAKERVRRWVDRNHTLRPISSKVVGFLLEHLNRERGYDWHTAGAIAEDLGVRVSAIEKAFGQLGKVGIILRDVETVKGRGRATRRWRTTIPMLVRAAEEIASEHGGKDHEPTQKSAMDPPKKSNGPTQEIKWTRPEKPDEPTQEMAVEPIEEPIEESLPPLPPKRAKRARRARGRDKANSVLDVDQLLAALRKEPDWSDVTSLLIEPILRQRKFLAPDPAYTLTELAKWAADLPAGVLKAARFKVLETRHSAVEGEHIVAAVRAVEEGIGRSPRLDRPGAKAVAADGQFTISEREQPEAFAAWRRRKQASLQRLARAMSICATTPRTRCTAATQPGRRREPRTRRQGRRPPRSSHSDTSARRADS